MLQNEYAWWLPPKSLRFLLAAGLWVLTGILLLRGDEVPDQLWTMDSVVAALYFAASSNGNGG